MFPPLAELVATDHLSAAQVVLFQHRMQPHEPCNIGFYCRGKRQGISKYSKDCTAGMYCRDAQQGSLYVEVPPDDHHAAPMLQFGRRRPNSALHQKLLPPCGDHSRDEQQR